MNNADINRISPDDALFDASTAPLALPPKYNAFMGPNGIRAGWRLLLFLAFFIAIAQSFGFLFHHIPSVRAWHEALPKAVMSAPGMIFDEGFTFFALFLAAWLMSLIEKRSFADYYLPPTQAFAKRFWQGVPYGFAMLSLLIAVIAMFHGFSIEGMALAGGTAVKYGVLYGIAFILVGLFEEFSFRGYMQSTLGSGIGFWPAAIVLSLLFGAIHLQNLNEAPVGAVMAATFGLLAAFSLKTDRQHLVPHRHACSVGLGRDLFLFHARQRFRRTGASDELVLPRCQVVDRRSGGARRKRLRVSSAGDWRHRNPFYFSRKPETCRNASSLALRQRRGILFGRSSIYLWSPHLRPVLSEAPRF